MLAFLPLTLAATLQEDVTQQFVTPPQVGYAFASLCMGSEDGENSFVEGSRAHIIAAAKVLVEHPEARVLIEGHVGVSAPAPKFETVARGKDVGCIRVAESIHCPPVHTLKPDVAAAHVVASELAKRGAAPRVDVDEL